MQAREVFRRYGLGLISLLCLAAGWVLFFSFTQCGAACHAETWWVDGMVACLDVFVPTAGLLAVGGLLFDKKKLPALMALLLTLASAFLLYV